MRGSYDRPHNTRFPGLKYRALFHQRWSSPQCTCWAESSAETGSPASVPRSRWTMHARGGEFLYRLVAGRLRDASLHPAGGLHCPTGPEADHRDLKYG